MKRLIWVLLGAGAIIAMAGIEGNLSLVSPATPLCPWRQIGTITVAQAYPLVSARSYTSVTAIADANTCTWLTIPDSANYVQLRFVTTANSDSTTVAVLVAANDTLVASPTNRADDFMYGGTLALTGGQQYAGAAVYVDTITATGDGVLDWDIADSGNDRVCVATADFKGFKRLCLVATNLAAKSTLKVEARFY